MIQRTLKIITDPKLNKKISHLKLNETATYLAAVCKGGRYVKIVDCEAQQVKAELYRGFAN